MASARRMVRTDRIAVIGGQSSIGQALLAGPLIHAVPFVRRPDSRKASRLVSDYSSISARDLHGFDAVINCTGATSGSREELFEANCTLPTKLAFAARAAGVGRFLHVSSFSILGEAKAIDSGSQAKPVGDYGKSKFEGDLSIMAQAGSDLVAIPLRLPSIIDAQRPRGKVERLIRNWVRFGVLPVRRGDIRRSMISTTLAARVLANLLGSEIGGVRYAADPEYFTFRRAREAIEQGCGKSVRVLPLPPGALRPVAHLAPSVYKSLFTDSALCPASNEAAGLESDLYPTIANIAGAR